MKFTEYVEVNPKTNLKKGEYAPFVEMANVSITYREPEKIEYKKYTSGPKFQNGDSVVARIEPCLQNGKRFFWKSDKIGFGSTEYIVFRAKEGKMDSKYLFYLLKTDYIKKSMVSSMVGATGRQRVNNDIFGQIEIVVPNIEKQKKIGRTLFLYDDLIENNQKQIKLLEEAAQRLYKEWFVDLRFPGHENTKIVDGVPEGWSRGLLKELISVNYGKDHKKAPDDGNIPVYGSGGLMRKCNKSLFSGEAVLIPRKGSLNNIMYVDETFWTVDTMFYATMKQPHTAVFVYFFVKAFDMYSMNIGAAVPSMTTKILDAMDVVIPDKETLEKFDKLTKTYFNKIKTLQGQNERLKTARDLLLPKFMSGEVEV